MNSEQIISYYDGHVNTAVKILDIIDPYLNYIPKNKIIELLHKLEKYSHSIEYEKDSILDGISGELEND